MIHGDIDLTENLDFYRDRKSKEYKNSKDFLPPAIRDNLYSPSGGPSVWTNISATTASTITSNTITWTGNNQTMTFHNVNSDDFDFTTSLEITVPSNLNNLNNNWTYMNDHISTTNTYNHYSDAITSITYTSNNGNTTYYHCNIPVDDYNDYHKPSICEKLFGTRKLLTYSSKYYYFRGNEIHYKCIDDLFGERPVKKYHNTRDFREHRREDIDELPSRQRRWWFKGWGDQIIADIDNIFGSRKDPYIDEEKGIPWLNELRRENKHRYDDYMDELLGNEVKDDSSYLTNYGWLRMRDE